MKKTKKKSLSEVWSEKYNKELSKPYKTAKEVTDSILGKRKFDTGAVRDNDEGKEDYIETISWVAFKRYAQYMTSKKARYGSGNFKKGIPIESYEQSLVRHLQKYLANKYEGGNTEKDDDHISAMVFNLFGIMHEEERK